MIFKILLALLLLSCLLNIPNEYFYYIRIGSCLGFVYLAYQEFEDKKKVTALFSFACAILLNPLLKIYLTRQVSNCIDVAIAITLIVWVILDVATKKKEV